MKVPRDIATCPTCNGTLWLDIEVWEDETGVPLEEGCAVTCTRSQHSGTMETQMPYIYWLPINVKVAAWARQNVRIAKNGSRWQRVEGPERRTV